jgi:hypothetical protein
VNALQKAFTETMTDPEFVADAAKAKMPIDPLDGAQIQALLNDAFSAPKSVRDRVAEYFLPTH